MSLWTAPLSRMNWRVAALVALLEPSPNGRPPLSRSRPPRRARARAPLAVAKLERLQGDIHRMESVQRSNFENVNGML